MLVLFDFRLMINTENREYQCVAETHRNDTVKMNDLSQTSLLVDSFLFYFFFENQIRGVFLHSIE